jgi:DNA-binding beta-propeller fold protein YncE
VVKNVGFQTGDWHHLVMTWNHFDTSKSDAEATLYIDGKVAGRLADRDIAMRWDADRAGIYVAVNYLGLLDELALFDRPLTAGEVRYLHERPNFSLWQRKPVTDVDFKPSTDFVKLPGNMTLGACSAVAANSKGEIFLFHRGEHPIIVLDANGKYLRSWGDDVIERAHGLRIDHDDNVWITDIRSHRVLKFDSTGKLLLALGTGKRGTDEDQFNKPTDIAFGPHGEVYISDGYGNSRVLQFTPGGRLIRSWGTPGKGRGQFDLPHSILVDRRGRVLVGDRENDRIQVFDSEGTLLDIWQGFAPYGMATDRNGHLYVADGRANKILRLNDSGHVVQRWGGKGTAPGQFNLPHMLCFDNAGNLYVAEVNGKRLQRLIVRQNRKDRS